MTATFLLWLLTTLGIDASVLDVESCPNDVDMCQYQPPPPPPPPQPPMRPTGPGDRISNGY